MATLLVVDDHEIVRVGLKLLIEAWPNAEVIGEAKDGAQAIALVGEKHPDVVLMDVCMPVMDGIEAARNIKTNWPEVGIIMLTSHGEESSVLAALAAGAHGYCLKTVSSDRLKIGVLTILNGDVWLDSEVAHVALNALLEGRMIDSSAYGGAAAAADEVLDELTDNELEVLKLVVEGQSNQQIADSLSISQGVVKTRLKNIMEKLAVSDRTQAAVKAVRRRMV